MRGNPDNPVYRCREHGRCHDCHRKTYYLAGPGHTPYNAEANWVCRAHMDSDARVIDTRKWK